MTVAEAKGLEFDAVFLWDFFDCSPADWLPLNNYTLELEDIEEREGSSWDTFGGGKPCLLHNESLTTTPDIENAGQLSCAVLILLAAQEIGTDAVSVHMLSHNCLLWAK